MMWLFRLICCIIAFTMLFRLFYKAALDELDDDQRMGSIIAFTVVIILSFIPIVQLLMFYLGIPIAIIGSILCAIGAKAKKECGEDEDPMEYAIKKMFRIK